MRKHYFQSQFLAYGQTLMNRSLRKTFSSFCKTDWSSASAAQTVNSFPCACTASSTTGSQPLTRLPGTTATQVTDCRNYPFCYLHENGSHRSPNPCPFQRTPLPRALPSPIYPKNKPREHVVLRMSDTSNSPKLQGILIPGFQLSSEDCTSSKSFIVNPDPCIDMVELVGLLQVKLKLI